MSYGTRDPNANTGVHAITKTYGILVLAALAVLVLFHRLFGSVRIEGGAR